MQRMPRSRANALISAMGIRRPVAEMTWLTLITRVAGVIAAAKRRTMVALSCSSSAIGIRSTTTPWRCAMYAQHKLPPSCSRSVVSTRSPAVQCMPCATVLIASVVHRVINNSSCSQPRKLAARLRTRSAADNTVFSTLPYAMSTGLDSSSRQAASVRSSTTRGVAPREAVLRWIRPGGNRYCDEMSWPAGASDDAAPELFDSTAACARLPIDAAPSPAMNRRRESVASDVMRCLYWSSVSVEHQNLRERLTFSVCALVGDGQDFSIWRDGAHGNAHRFAVSFFRRLDSPCIDAHGVQRVVTSRTCHRIVPPVIFIGVTHLHLLASGTNARPGNRNPCRGGLVYPDLALPRRTGHEFRLIHIQLPGAQDRIV